MLGLTQRTRVFAYAKPVDLRKSFHTLSEVVRSEMDRDPLSGDIYLFVNRRCTLAKCLAYDGSGLCIFMKRISEGRFAAPWNRAYDDVIKLTATELQLFIDGSKLAFAGVAAPQMTRRKSVVQRALTV